MDFPIINLQNLISEEACYALIRQSRWPEQVTCPHCQGHEVIKRGKDDKERACQRYGCSTCNVRFDDLTGTLFSGRHQPLSKWILCLYFMGLNLSNEQIAKELDLNPSDVYKMTAQLRDGVDKKKPLLLCLVKLNLMKFISSPVTKANPVRLSKPVEKVVVEG